MLRRSSLSSLALTTVAALATSVSVSAQLNNPWLTYAPGANRIQTPGGAPATAITSDADEKDIASGDLDKDGWVDLVIVRKEPYTTTGKRVNYLLMNQNGVLVDRTAQYAVDSDVAGDFGFQTPTNDRDVQLVDVDGDGWLDVVTATTLSSTDPKHVSHPRIYHNKGSIGGVWQGLRFENARIPQLTAIGSGVPMTPALCAVAVGDVTGDGAPDLYLVDYTYTTPDLNDRLLINDGNGFFTDSLETRMTATMLASGFGTSGQIVDINGDGRRDIVRGMSGGITAAYNNPANQGFFNLFQNDVGTGAPYHVDTGDLNQDGRPDIIGSDDGIDFYRYNTGNDALGRVIWGPYKNYQFLSNGDDGIGGNNMVVDLDGDGWNDTIHADVDVDIPGCERRMHIYHNPGGAIGSQITLREESQLATSGGWKGAVGLTAADLGGTYDFAVFDLDNDGDKDLVLGRCSGVFVWLNQKFQPPTWTLFCAGDGSGTACPCANESSIGAQEGCIGSLGFAGKLRAAGVARVGADTFTLNGTQVPDGPGLYFQGTTKLVSGAGATFGDGLRCAGGSVIRLGIVIGSGNASQYPRGGVDAAISVKGFVAAGDTREYQLWYRDSGSFCTSAVFNLTNGLETTWAP